MEGTPTPERGVENSEKIEKLESYLREGYLLHGGKSRLEVLEPRQATDTNPERTTGKAFAIYAEDKDIRIPIVMALFDKKDPSIRESYSSYSAHGPGSIMIITGENCTLTKGYVHVLPSHTFELEGNEHDSELISKTPITPIEIIDVDPSILNHLEGIDNRLE